MTVQTAPVSRSRWEYTASSLGRGPPPKRFAFLQSGEEISLGRDVSCDVRIRLPAVSRVHCKIIACENKVRVTRLLLGGRPVEIAPGVIAIPAPQVWLLNVSKTGKTQVNGAAISEPTLAFHTDEFTVATRNFRIRYESGFQDIEEVRAEHWVVTDALATPAPLLRSCSPRYPTQSGGCTSSTPQLVPAQG